MNTMFTYFNVSLLMKRSHLLLLFFLLFGGIKHTVGQSYRFTMGLRLSDGYARMLGLTAQNRLAKKLTLESIVQSDFTSNHTGHVLIQRHHNLITRRINYYYGTGLSFGQEVSFMKNPDTGQRDYTYDNYTLGADLLLGLELTMLHLNVSWDLKPNFNMLGRENWITWQTGISVRSVILKNKKKKKESFNVKDIFNLNKKK